MSVLTRSKALPPDTVTVTVAAAATSGSNTVKLYGEVTDICVKPPSDDSLFAFEIVDEDGYGRFGKSGCQGMSNFPVGRMFHGTYTVNITAASETGSYGVRSWTK